MFSSSQLAMHPMFTTSYLVPGLLLNPVLFLWSLNTLLSRLLPPIIVDAAIQPAPYYPRGPSAQHPHFDIHASESLCWSYTAFIVCANLAAFGRVSERRQAGKERARLKRELIQRNKVNGNGKAIHMNGEHGNGNTIFGQGYAKKQNIRGEGGDPALETSEDATTEEDYLSTTDSDFLP